MTGMRRVWTAAATGLLWAQAAIATQIAVLPNYLVAGERISQGLWYRLATWTLLAPLALACRVTGRQISEPDRLALALCPLVGVALCIAGSHALVAEKWRRPARQFMAAVTILGAACGAVVVMQVVDSARAESTFFSLLSRVEVSHKDPSVVARARAFAERYPDSRWTAEALRIVAMAEWDAGRIENAATLWSRFAECFADRSAPGVAYAQYNLALCDDRLGRDGGAADHLRAAIGAIRTRGDGIQAWIASEAATRLAAHERSEGRYAQAAYWNSKSKTFSDVYSLE